jgi:dinuclear metal center YbgI/SA1388 family protein
MIAPPRLAAEWDPVGLQIGAPEQRVERLAVCHEISDDAIGDLAEVDLVVVYHPLIFRPLARLVPGGVPGRVLQLASAGTAVISVHTNFDAVAGGTADSLAAALGLERPLPFAPLHTSPGSDRSEPVAMIGRVGDLAPMPVEDLAEMVGSALGGTVRVAVATERAVTRVAVVPGSGADFVADAVAVGAEVLVTGDIGHHRARAALDAGLSIIDPGHMATERPGLAALYAAVCTIVAELAPDAGVEPVMIGGRDTDPWERS